MNPKFLIPIVNVMYWVSFYIVGIMGLIKHTHIGVFLLLMIVVVFLYRIPIPIFVGAGLYAHHDLDWSVPASIAFGLSGFLIGLAFLAIYGMVNIFSYWNQKLNIKKNETNSINESIKQNQIIESNNESIKKEIPKKPKFESKPSKIVDYFYGYEEKKPEEKLNLFDKIVNVLFYTAIIIVFLFIVFGLVSYIMN